VKNNSKPDDSDRLEARRYEKMGQEHPGEFHPSGKISRVAGGIDAKEEGNSKRHFC